MLKRMKMCLLAALVLGCLTPVVAAEPIVASSVHLKLVDEVDVPAQEEGELLVVDVREGQMVEAGHLLARIRDNEVRLARQQAQLELMVAERKAADDSAVKSAAESVRVAKADLQLAKEAQGRISDLLSPTELDHLQLALVQAEAALLRAQTESAVLVTERAKRVNDLEFSELELQRHRLFSPIEGMVVEIHQQRGEWVQAGDKVVRVIRLDVLYAEGFIQLDELRPGLEQESVIITVDGKNSPPARYEGKIVFVHPVIVPLSKRVRVRAMIRNIDHQLRPGQSVRMTIGTQ